MNLLQSLARRRTSRANDLETLALYLNESFKYFGQTYFTQAAPSYGGNVSSESPTGFFPGLAAQGLGGNGPVYACIQTRAFLFSQAEFMWRRNSEEGRRGDLFANTELRVLEYPWAGGTTADLLAGMEIDVSLAGNAFIARREGRLVRLRPDFVSIYMESPNRYEQPALDPEATVEAYLYSPPNGDRMIVYEPGEVCHYAPMPDPLAAFRGMSWLTPVLRDIDADQGATSYKNKFFEHAATPNMVIKFDPTVPQQKVKEFAAFWTEHMEGKANAYRTGYLGGGADIVPVGQSFEQMQYRAVQGAGETRIAAAAGVPPVIVGLSEGLQAATYSNYAQARKRLADGTMWPLWKNVSGSLETFLKVPPRSRLAVDPKNIAWLREDEKERAEIRQADAHTIRSLIDAGYDPDAVVEAVTSDDLTVLEGEHSGLYSVQLQPPGMTQQPEEAAALADFEASKNGKKPEQKALNGAPKAEEKAGAKEAG